MNEFVAKARFLNKYKVLVFVDPDHKERVVQFTVHEDNLEYHRGREEAGVLLVTLHMIMFRMSPL